jgi:DNA-binding HxlR family transcriptional regulator
VSIKPSQLQVEYSLTPLGHTFTEPLWALKKWAKSHVEEIEASRAAWDSRLSAAGEEGDTE